MSFPTPEELARRLAAAPPIESRLPCEVGFYVLAALQLTLRHPTAPGSRWATVVRDVALQLQAALTERVPEARDLLEAGWHPEHDA